MWGIDTRPLMTIVNRKDSLANAISGMGTAKDSGVASRPTLVSRLTNAELEYLYLQDDLARRIVDEMVEDALRQGYVVRDEESDEVVEIEDKKFERMFHRRLARACKNGRLYGAGALFMINEEGAKDFSKPLDYSESLPTNLMTLDRLEMSTSDYILDPLDPHFGATKTYYISPSHNGGIALSAPRAHHSRVLIFGGASLPERLQNTFNDEFDDSELQSVFPALRRFGDVENAIAAIVQRFDTAQFSIKGLADILGSQGGAAKILARIDLVNKTVSAANAVVVDSSEGEGYTRQFATLNGLDTIWDRLAHSVSKAARMPMTQLFGMSPSGLSTDDESGRANWRKQVSAYQQDKLLEPLTHFYTWVNGGKPVTIEFHALDEATAKEEAEVAKIRAEERKTYVDATIVDPDEYRKVLVEEGILKDEERPVETDANELLQSAEEFGQPLPEGPGGPGQPANAVPQPGPDEEGVPGG